MSSFGLYINGEKSGIWWNRLEGGSFYIKNHEHNYVITAFIYPDLHSVLKGIWRSDTEMNETKSGFITGFKQDKAILVPEVEIDGKVNFQSETRSIENICQFPTVSDPFEFRQVEVKQSLIFGAGEGLFSKTYIPKGQIVAYFNGAIASNSTSEYSISLEPDLKLDIPEDQRDSYCATMGHKICHSFNPNAKYDFAFHPRFGRIRCAVSLRNIESGEEITCDYKYSWKKAPIWYKNSLKEFLVKVLKLSDQKVEDFIKKFENDSKGL